MSTFQRWLLKRAIYRAFVCHEIDEVFAEIADAGRRVFYEDNDPTLVDYLLQSFVRVMRRKLPYGAAVLPASTKEQQ